MERTKICHATGVKLAVLRFQTCNNHLADILTDHSLTHLFVCHRKTNKMFQVLKLNQEVQSENYNLVAEPVRQ